MAEKKRLHSVQVPPGWGVICSTCKHTLPDEEKYVDWPPQLACRNCPYDPGFYDKTKAPPEYNPPTFVWQLHRWADESETCENFEPCPQPE